MPGQASWILFGLVAAAAQPVRAEPPRWIARAELVSKEARGCDTCELRIEQQLPKRTGVEIHRVEVDPPTGRVRIEYWAPTTTRFLLAKNLWNMGFPFASEWGQYPDGADRRLISSDGEDVLVEERIAPGKITVIAFNADWCQECKDLDLRLATLSEKHPRTLAVRKLNIASWDSPVAQRYLAKGERLPRVHIYAPDGTRVEVFAGADRVDGALALLLGG